jgi:YidC/Oxa1 family membrane protein insertase
LENQRNIILAVVFTALILFGWEAACAFTRRRGPRRLPAHPPCRSGKRLLPTREGGLRVPAFARRQGSEAALAARTRAVVAPGLSG